MVDETLLRRIVALIVMIIGSTVVFGTVVLMNRETNPPEKEKIGSVVDFTVTTPRQETERRDPPPQQRSTQSSDQPALAPLPDLGGGLSSIQVAMPEFEPNVLGASPESLLGDFENVVMTDDSVDEKPAVLSSPLIYPKRAKQREIEGKVVVSVLIGTEGRVKEIKILESQPPGVFDEAVLEALPNWMFSPAKYQNRPVQIWVTIPLDFSLR